MLYPGVRALFDQMRRRSDVAVPRVVSEHTQRRKALRVTDGEQNLIRTQGLRDNALGLVWDGEGGAAGITEEPREGSVLI